MGRPKNRYPEARLTEQTNGIWWVEWTEDSKNRRESTGTKNEREARIYLNRKSLELLTPPKPQERLTIEQVCQAYIDAKKIEGKNIVDMRGSLKGIRKFLGNAFYDTLTDEVMREYVNWRREQGFSGPAHIVKSKKGQTISNHTIKREIAVLRAALKLCARQKLIDIVPVPLCPVSVSRTRVRFLSKDEYVRILAASENNAPHIHLYLQIALLTGQRRKAILSLKWDSIELDAERLTYDMIASYHGITDEQEREANEQDIVVSSSVLNNSQTVRIDFGDDTGKKRKAPPIEVNDEMLLHSLHRAYKNRKSEYVIEWHGKPIKDIKTGLRRACERAGVEPISSHVMRHTTISWLIIAGKSSTTVAHRVNVSQEIIDRNYAHMSPEIQREMESILSVAGLAKNENVR